jgi:hypothetical protein
MTRSIPVFNFHRQNLQSYSYSLQGTIETSMSIVSNMSYAGLKELDLQERHLFPPIYNCAFTSSASDLCLGC